ncbi:MAG: TolC family protein [Flavobacterium sp.]
MLQNKYYIVISCLIACVLQMKAQTLPLDSILVAIKKNNPQLKMYDADVQSMDAAAKGARVWMPPQIETGFFMTPYNTDMWKANDMNPGMGNYMLGVTQMIPISNKNKSEFNYMSAMSSVEKENRNYTLNQLNAFAKINYYQWLILSKKIKIVSDNLSLLDYMIKSMEIRYQYNMDKLPTYYKAKSLRGSTENMLSMYKSETYQRRSILNSLMYRDKSTTFEIDSTFQIKEYNLTQSDTSVLSKNRSDIKAIEKNIELNRLKTEAEKTKTSPEFGIKYDHMFTFGQQPDMFSLVGMITIPMPWSTKMKKANVESLQIKNESLKWQKQMILNETSGMLSGMIYELQNAKKQYEISQNSIIPSLKKNYDTSVLAWQNNTVDLFNVLDAWETLNMAQLDTLDKLQKILNTQVEIEKQLEIK